MGASVAATVVNSGHQVFWASEGRSAQTHGRAEKIGLRDLGSMAALCERCSMIVSVCPPHAAEAVADQVLAHSFAGLYLDANAISPGRATRIRDKMAGAGVSFVDGGIMGRPGSRATPGSTFRGRMPVRPPRFSRPGRWRPR